MLGSNKKVLRFHWYKAYIARKYFLLFHLTLPGSYCGFVHVIYTSFLTHHWTDTHTPLINPTKYDVIFFCCSIILFVLNGVFIFLGSF